MPETQFIKNPFTSRFCEMMNIPVTHDRQPAKYLIGQPNPASIANPGFMAVCESCARSIVEKLPDELLAHVNIERALELMEPEARAALLDGYFRDMEKVRAETLGEHIQEPTPPPDSPNIDTSQPIPCPYCDFSAKNRAGLSSHIKTKHPGDGK